MLIGQDHTPTGVIPGVQCAVHRISIDVDLNQPDSTLRHQIYTENMPENLFQIYPHGGKTMKQFLDQCRDMNVVPMINLNFGRRIWDVDGNPYAWRTKYTLDQWERLSRLTAEIFCNLYDFGEKYLLVFNEPCKWLDRHEIGLYTRATNGGIGSMRSELPIVVGNEEWDLAEAKGNAYHYWLVHFQQDFDFVGAHPLSSIMGDAYWKIKAWKELASEYNKPILATEAGSWEHRYTSSAGHERNKQIIRECKHHGYGCCNIVLIDSNSSYYPRLGYRGWNRDYSDIVEVPTMADGRTYFEDFMQFIQRKGRKEMTEYKAPDSLKDIADTLGNKIGEYSKDLPVLTGTGLWQNHNNVHGENPDVPVTKRDLDCLVEKLLKIKGFDISVYYNKDGTWNADWDDIAESNPEE